MSLDRPPKTNVSEQFEAYITSLKTWPFDKIPGGMWRRLHETIDTNDKKACLEAYTRIAEIFDVQPIQIQEKLNRFSPFCRKNLDERPEPQIRRQTRLTRNRLRISLFPFNKTLYEKY